MTRDRQSKVPAPTAEVDAGIPLPPIEESLGAFLVARAKGAASGPGGSAQQAVAVRARAATGKWVDLSWDALLARVRAIGAGLRQAGVEVGERVAVIAHNSPEMLLAELAIVSIGAVSVPLFPDYNSDVLRACLLDCGARVALCGSAVQQHKIGADHQLRRVIVLDDQPLPDDARAQPLSTLEQSGAASEAGVAEVAAAQLIPRPNEPAFLLYTSGTSGKPKGVELTHRNVLSQQAALGAVWDVGPGDVFLAYLPWHHCFGSLFERFMALHKRALLVLDDSRGRDLDRLLANVREVKPTVYFSVPRVFEALVRRAKSDPATRAALLHPGLRFVFTAAAPLSPACYAFFHEHGVAVHEGWGLTETSPCVTVTRPGTQVPPGVVGWPIPGTTVRLAPVEQATRPGEGEICVRGPQVMRGYHRDESLTMLVRGVDGWLRTGDLGEWTEHGLRVHGRVDGVFKLQNGEKVPSGEVEARMLGASPLLDQVLVLGPGQPHATALAWLSVPAVHRFAESIGLDADVLTDPTLVPEVRRAVIEAIQSSNQLARVVYERVHRVALVPTPLTVDSGLLTPSFKVQRTAALLRHAELADALQRGLKHPLVLDIVRGADGFQHA